MPLAPRHSKAIRAVHVLRDPRTWGLPTGVVVVVALALSVLYMGGILNPQADLKNLPVALVSSDEGANVGGTQTNAGDRVVEAVRATGDGAIDWRVMTADEARAALARDEVFGALEVPAGFTAALAGLGGSSTDPQRPVIAVLTNQGAGSLGSSLASTAAQAAAHEASATIGERLLAQTGAQGVQGTAAAALLLADPVSVVVSPGHALGAHSGAGLSAFYFTLLLVLAGFIGATVVSTTVDGALGYADTEYGPFHTRRAAAPISRAQTFLAKAAISVALAVVTSALVMFATIWLLGMDAGHLPLLYAFSVCASAAVALGVHAINTVFGGLGQLVAMFVFIVLALPSSGATVPLEALPAFYRFLATFEPMRQLSDGVRSILYFDAQATGALPRAWSMIALGTVLALAGGLLAARSYDRRGLRRLGHPLQVSAREAVAAAA
jgi:YhgE/Pip-like protein